MPGADTCIATQALARNVEERLGRSVFVSAAEADLSVEGRIEKAKAGGWRAVLTVRDATGKQLGTRELTRPDASCDAMNEPLTLVIALMIDPEAAMRPKPEPTPPVPTTTASEEPPPPPPPPPPTATTAEQPTRPPPSRYDQWNFEGLGAVTFASGLTPSVAVGAGVEALLYPPRIPVGFRGFTTLFYPSTADKDGAKASLDMLYLGGALCPTIRGQRINVMGCLGGHLGLIRPRAETSGRGIKENILPIWNALAELRVSIPIVRPIGFQAGVGAALPLFRSTIEYRTTTGAIEELHKVSIVVLTADAGLGFVFP